MNARGSRRGRGRETANPDAPRGLAAKMKAQGYHFVGGHSATKICAYAASSIKGGTTCYKHQFYGLRSWRCVQSTPALNCNLACAFCWRTIPEEEGYGRNELNPKGGWDPPKKIADGLIAEHQKILSGYKGNAKTDLQRLAESKDPAHVALSLTGEPLFYPEIGGLLDEFHRRRMSTFLVTNGTMAAALERIASLPTQLYVSVQAPNEGTYAKTVRPKNAGATWNNSMEFLETFSTLHTRRTFRLTLVKGLNMADAKGYAKLIEIGNPHYVEVKGFVFVGGSRNPKRGLEFDQMPRKDDILNFAREIANESGYALSDYHKSSNVALLCRDESSEKGRILKFQK